LSYPASFPHVLTVGATEESGIVTSFSSESVDVDVAAPGRRITVAEPLSFDSSGYITASGTSYSAPIVAGAAAWVWTARPQLDNTQLFDVMRMSAHDLIPAGYDQASGFGLLDIPSALAYPEPLRDPLEPNDDVDEVKPKAIFETGEAPLTTPTRTTTTVRARVDRREDPRDVYRAYVPPRRSLTARTSGAGVALRVFRSGVRSVISAAPAAARTSAGALTVRNVTARGTYLYVEVLSVAGVSRASYTLHVSASARR
jgi:subtilisin family serine protease